MARAATNAKTHTRALIRRAKSHLKRAAWCGTLVFPSRKGGGRKHRPKTKASSAAPKVAAANAVRVVDADDDDAWRRSRVGPAGGPRRGGADASPWARQSDIAADDDGDDEDDGTAAL